MKQLRAMFVGTVRDAGLASGRPGRVKVTLEVARVDGGLDLLAEMLDGQTVLAVELKSLQTAMDLEKVAVVAVDPETGEVLA